ncbi:hypothetical protein OIU84_017956 [Salix udensis]|uniref:Uncharacterized protein n=1 Tax=Salix udensis TaxID=889485 RepID=A0AAD6PN14_9ROSI|nr:hypothetical protein OIU84_017956 [Salix udensis]
MAKKKATHRTQDPKQENPQDQNQNFTTKNQQPPPPPPMENPDEKFQSLKTLNDLLVKEAKKRREQVESLVKAKEALETELALSSNEKSKLETEFGKISDGKRDLLKSDADNWMKEAGGLKDRVIELEKREKEGGKEIKKLKKQYALLVEEKNDREKEIEELKRLRGSTKNNLMERLKEIDDLKREIGGIVRERNEIGVEKSEQKLKIIELEREAGELNENVSSLQKEEGILRRKIMELEKTLGQALEKENAMAREIGGLMEEKKEKERTIMRLMEENDAGKKYKIMANAEIEDKKELVQKLLREKNEIEEVKAIKEGEIVKLHKEVVALEQVRLEKDNAQKSLDEEKRNGMNLRSKVLEMEKRAEETVKDCAKMRSVNESLAKRKKVMETQVSLLEKEKDLVQKHLTEAEGKINDLRNKMESAGTISDRALTMLKNTAALLCESNNGKEERIVTKKMLGSEIEPYASELEIIKTAFRKKETMVEDMKQQVEYLTDSVAKAKKKNGLLSVMSSATTVVAAAVSLAYVARVR